VKRRTKETDISMELNVDGSGRFAGPALRPFLGHLLATLARWGSLDIQVSASGDLEHHLEEDLALVLGRALRHAVDEGPIARAGHAMVPMDDALVMAALDLSGRPYVALDIEAGSPEEHFLRSLASEAGMNLHVVVMRGKDHHHIVEAAFKAVGLALHRAIRPSPSGGSTKGGVEWEVE
jgi:imidazoleglycerol-phosphate dehydratase